MSASMPLGRATDPTVVPAGGSREAAIGEPLALRPLRIHLAALGCRLNEAEVEQLEGEARRRGCRVVERPEDADWVLLNTCAVTHVAERKSRQALRRIHRQAPQARLAVLGCFGTISPDTAATLPGVQLVVPNADKARVLDLIAAQQDVALPLALPSPEPSRPRRTRAFIKVQDGCDNHCTYCIVRVARGPSHSVAAELVLQEVRARQAAGAREVVLSGVNLGAYGRDLPARHGRLADLVARILGETDVERVRLSSLEPDDLDERLLDLWQDGRLCRHLHLPLQSGSDAVLARMGRLSRVADYVALVKRVYAAVPDMALSADLIVGFPGETDEDARRTCALAERLALARLHIFRFSARSGTPAARYPNPVSDAVARERAQALSELARRLEHTYQQRFLGRPLSVLFEGRATLGGTSVWQGLSDNYLRIGVPSSEDLHNQIRTVTCLALGDEGLIGSLQS
ncbi:MAG: tRNA (N(6)-L-threonylcarbamoyladenosine(37)-C(2))-methylthiotransferase MtaB [Anaerolineae bacterium]|nr:tRNA (N(6)-L-threonylcarbamoyladenosine(37)-C(2))-methylthiotransferase MtaB [Chloroflexota bacterium]